MTNGENAILRGPPYPDAYGDTPDHDGEVKAVAPADPYPDSYGDTPCHDGKHEGGRSRARSQR
jgi:hypothetical protein